MTSRNSAHYSGIYAQSRRGSQRTHGYAEYERLKQDWIARNPAATSSEYEAAMRAIAKAAGV